MILKIKKKLNKNIPDFGGRGYYSTKKLNHTIRQPASLVSEPNSMLILYKPSFENYTPSYQAKKQGFELFISTGLDKKIWSWVK